MNEMSKNENEIHYLKTLVQSFRNLIANVKSVQFIKRYADRQSRNKNRSRINKSEERLMENENEAGGSVAHEGDKLKLDEYDKYTGKGQKKEIYRQTMLHPIDESGVMRGDVVDGNSGGDNGGVHYLVEEEEGGGGGGGGGGQISEDYEESEEEVQFMEFLKRYFINEYLSSTTHDVLDTFTSTSSFGDDDGDDGKLKQSMFSTQPNWFNSWQPCSLYDFLQFYGLERYESNLVLI
jgi:hypothetical protein